MKLVNQQESLATTPFQSAYDIAEVLKTRFLEIEKVFPESSTLKPAKSSLKSSTIKKDGEKKHVIIDEGLNTTSLIQKEKASVSSSSSSSSSLLPSKAQTTNPSPNETVFEIREFIDDKNQTQNFELLDVSKQLKYMENMGEVSAAAYSEDDEFIRELAAITERKEQTKRERMHPTRQVDEVDDLLQVLEKLEVRQTEKERNKSSSSGWKQGFLSSQKSGKEEKRSIKTVPIQQPATKQPDSTPSTSAMVGLPISEERPSTTSNSTVTTEKTPDTRKKPFSGVILEKF